MYLVWDVNPLTRIQPEFSISCEEIDYHIAGTDALCHPEGKSNGWPGLVIRSMGGGGFTGRVEEGIAVKQALTDLGMEDYGKTSLQVREILSKVPVSATLHNEHWPGGNTVTFSNRVQDSGIGIYMRMPFYNDYDYFEYLEKWKDPNPGFLQEARLLVVAERSLGIGKMENESVIFATLEQLNAILNLSLAISKLPEWRD